MFDSIHGFTVNSSSLKNRIAAILKTPTRSFNINFVDVQTQMGANDCGIYSICSSLVLRKRSSYGNILTEQNEKSSPPVLQYRKIRQLSSITKYIGTYVRRSYVGFRVSCIRLAKHQTPLLPMRRIISWNLVSVFGYRRRISTV